jgi:hypothetical protein
MAMKDMAKDAISILVVAGILIIAFFIGLIRDGDQYKDFFTILATITITLISVSIVFIVYILQQHSNKVNEIRGVEAEKTRLLSQDGGGDKAALDQLNEKLRAYDLIWFDSIIKSHISKEIIEFSLLIFFFFCLIIPVFMLQPSSPAPSWIPGISGRTIPSWIIFDATVLMLIFSVAILVKPYYEWQKNQKTS